MQAEHVQFNLSINYPAIKVIVHGKEQGKEVSPSQVSWKSAMVPWTFVVIYAMLNIILPVAFSRPGAGYQCYFLKTVCFGVLYLMYFKSPMPLCFSNWQPQGFWFYSLESSSELLHVFSRCPTFSEQSWIFHILLGRSMYPMSLLPRRTDFF